MKRFIRNEIAKYKLYTPSIEKVEDILKLRYTEYTPDHIAFRTFSHVGGMNIFKTHILNDYITMDTYNFPEKHIIGTWFKPINENDNLPRLFISELQCNKLSKSTQHLIKQFVNDKHYQIGLINNSQSVMDTFLNHNYHRNNNNLSSTQQISCPPQSLSYNNYQIVKQESEYAAWTLLHGNKINHIGISLDTINKHLPQIISLKALNDVLLENNLIIHVDNNKSIHTSKDCLLDQCSLIADKITMTFHDNNDNNTPTVTCNVSGGFVEFIHRKKGRDGFEESNANKIFESTSNIKQF